MYSTIKNFSVSVNCGNVELSEILNTFSRTIQGLNERIEYLENEFHVKFVVEKLNFSAFNIYLDGTICKKSERSGITDIDVTVSDDYDFHWHNDKNRPNEDWLLRAGNNGALISQYLHIIRTYHWTAEFKETRWLAK